jgi:chromosome segregation ATPase
VKTNTINYQPRTIDCSQKGCDNFQGEIIEEKAKKEHPIHKLIKHPNGETLRFLRLIKRLENENHRLESILEDFENDKLVQAQRIKELEHEKSALKSTLANIVSVNQNLKESLHEIDKSGKKTPHFIDNNKESYHNIQTQTQLGPFDIIGLLEKTRNYCSILTRFLYYKLVRLPKQD